jgi:hypothetical protein
MGPGSVLRTVRDDNLSLAHLDLPGASDKPTNDPAPPSPVT